LRHPDGFGLPASYTVEAIAATVPAGGLQPVAAEIARVVLPEERGDNQVTALKAGHVRAGVFNDADELMTHGPAWSVAGIDP
jgi:hypothetical protein